MTRERGVAIDRGYVLIRFWPWGRNNKPFIEHFGPVTDDNIKLANIKMREYRNKVALNTFGIERPAVPMICKEAWPLFLKNHKASLSSYTSRLVGFFGAYWLHDITPQLVKDYRKAREKAGVSFATVNKEQAILSSFLERFKEWNATGGVFADKIKIPAENPCQFVTKPTERQRARDRVLAPEEWERLSPVLAKIAVCRKNEKTPYLTAGWLLDHSKIALYGSMSLKDISKLSGKAITGDVLKDVRSKSGIGLSLPLTETTRAIALRISARPFVSSWIVQHYFRMACQEAGIKDFTFRDLRRTSLRWLDKKHTRRTVVRDRASHADSKTTDIYLGSDMPEQFEAVETLQGIFK